MITTTLNRIRAHGLPENRLNQLLAGLNKTACDDEPLPYARVVDLIGLHNALWCCRAEPQYTSEWRFLVTTFCPPNAHRLVGSPSSIAAMAVADRHRRGLASDDELTDALMAAWAAAEASREAEREWQIAEFLRLVTETEARS